jgi:hypothetical protein
MTPYLVVIMKLRHFRRKKHVTGMRFIIFLECVSIICCWYISLLNLIIEDPDGFITSIVFGSIIIDLPEIV